MEHSDKRFMINVPDFDRSRKGEFWEEGPFTWEQADNELRAWYPDATLRALAMKALLVEVGR